MWKSVSTKIAIGVLGAGTIATGVAFAATNNNNSYENYLNKKGRKLLPQDSKQWATLVSKYVAEGDDLLITIDGKDVAKASVNEKQLKSWCSENSKKKFTNTDDKNYQKVSAWCTEPKTILELIGKENVALEDTDPSSGGNQNEDKWTEKVNEYKNQKNKDLIKVISVDKEGADVATANFSDAKKLKDWCKFSKNKHFKHEKDSRFLKYLKWCTSPST